MVTDDFVGAIEEINSAPRGNFAGRKWVKENLIWDKFCGNMLWFFEEVME